MYRAGDSYQTVHGDHVITDVAALPFPLAARLDKTNEPLTLLQTCNWRDHSPSNIGLDAKGKQVLVTFAEVTVIGRLQNDSQVIPNSLGS